MKLPARRLAAVLSFSLVPLCCGAATPNFDDWAEATAQAWVRTEPMLATRTQYLAPAEAEKMRDALVGPDGYYPVDPSARSARIARAKRGLEELRQWSRADLSPTQQVSHDLLNWRWQNTIRATEAAGSAYVFDQRNGPHIELINFLTQVHPLRTPRDAQAYVARLRQIAPVLDRAVVEAEARAERGIMPPRFILEATIGGLDRFLKPAPRDNVLVTSLAERTAVLKDFSAEDRSRLLAQAETVVTDEIRPAFKRIHALLTIHSATATNDAGFWKLPHGDLLYATQLATYTTTTLTADQIHAQGLRQVAELEREMDTLLRQLGYTEGSVKDRYVKLNATAIPPLTPDPRPAIVAEYAQIVREAERRAPAFFDLMPKAPVEVRREPPFTEAGAAAHYTAPAPDGSRPGIFWLPIASLDPDVMWVGVGMKTVAFHEAVPGHHYQVTLQQELPDLPRFRKLRVYGGISAFSEGWGLYAERLADEAGWYEGDPRGRLGYLQAQLFRARRLVVDTGLHTKKWTRQQAIDYGIQPSEVDRYVASPGQACSYMLGQLRILELREKARAALGAKFSLKEFHNLLLRTGEVPLDLLSSVVERWIATSAR